MYSRCEPGLERTASLSPVQRQVFSALSQISKHSVSLAEMVVEAEVFPAAMATLRDPDQVVRKNVTALMRELVKHTPEVPHTLVGKIWYLLRW